MIVKTISHSDVTWAQYCSKLYTTLAAVISDWPKPHWVSVISDMEVSYAEHCYNVQTLFFTFSIVINAL